MIGRHIAMAALTCTLACSLLRGAEAPPLKVLLLDGQNNHDWRSTTPVIKSALEASGRFKVTVLSAPGRDAAPAAWESFKPIFSDYDVVVSNFTDFGAKPCPTAWLNELCRYVRGGGGFVAVHAATSGMYHYPEYARLVGMGWQNVNGGDRLAVDDSGRTVRTPKGQGPGTVHGRPFAWVVTMWAAQHPVCAGLPRQWMHVRDELWGAARGPAQEVEVLATAVAPETKQNEPVLWTVGYGSGRAFVTLLGHDAASMKCVGFQVTLARGCEWAATGKVTQPAPARFPAKDTPLPAD